MVTLIPIRISKFHDLAHGALSALASKYRSEKCPALRTAAVGLQDAKAGVLSDLVAEDWDVLFRAVLARLGSTLADPNTRTADGTADAQLSRARTGILDCVEALHQLRTTMTHELARHRQPDPDLAAAQVTPARMRPEPVVSLARECHVGRPRSA